MNGAGDGLGKASDTASVPIKCQCIRRAPFAHLDPRPVRVAIAAIAIISMFELPELLYRCPQELLVFRETAL